MDAHCNRSSPAAKYLITLSCLVPYIKMLMMKVYIYTAKIRSCFNLGVVISVSYSDEITVARSHIHTLAQHSLHTTT